MPSSTSLYVHVPFCVIKCGYCDFNSYAEPAVDVHDRFLRALDQELDRALADREPPGTVFVGGGTPTYLDPVRFEGLLAILARHVDLAACAEVTIEANPESLTAAKAGAARAAGIGRISIGAQTFDEGRLRLLDRAHDADAIRAAVAAARDGGFENLSLDLMFGIPGEDAAQWRADLDAALALGPDHLSCYNLTFETGTRFERDRRRGALQPNEPDVDLESFLLTRRVLREHGFEAYEVSNFAGRGGRCLHNDHYWLQGDYVGVGPGAASHACGERTTNLKAVSGWATAIERGESPVGEREVLTPEQRSGEALWLGLRRRDGVDLPDVHARTGVDPAARFEAEIEGHVRRGHLRSDGTRLVLTEAGLPLLDAIATSFLG